MDVHLFTLALLLPTAYGQYQPTWESLDARPLPAWYDQAKFGIFIHWGVFSVPSYISEWFWHSWKGFPPDPRALLFMAENYPDDFTYADFAPEFTAELFDPNEWADILKASGAKYVVLTSKHHEGYSMWDSSYSWNWNAKAVGPRRDLVDELAKSIRNRTELHFGLYHSLFEWFNPLYLEDKSRFYSNGTYPQTKPIPELHQIVNKFKPEVIWSDGDWEAPSSYWTSTDFLAWLYNESPVKDVVVTNDRWGSDTSCKHGGFYTCGDKYNPGILQPHKWENCMTIDSKSWGYRRDAVFSDFLTIDTLISTLATTISCGGNLLVNIGPTKDGKITPIFEERLRQMGQWLAVNGEAVYESVPWTYQNDSTTPDIWYTSKVSDGGSTVVYAFVLNWPKGGLLVLGSPVVTPDTLVTMLGVSQRLSWTEGHGGKGLVVVLPSLDPGQLPWSWVLKLEHLQAQSRQVVEPVETFDPEVIQNTP